jgi:hypothetical protein
MKPLAKRLGHDHRSPSIRWSRFGPPSGDMAPPDKAPMHLRAPQRSIASVTPAGCVAALGWTRAETRDTRLRLRSFHNDWDAPGMEVYDEVR